MIKRGSKIKLHIDFNSTLALDLFEQFNNFHSMNIYPLDNEIEKYFYYNKIENLTPKHKSDYGGIKFTPSSADKCSRELYYKFINITADTVEQLPYHKRWTRNSTAVHESTQLDLLYMEKYLKDPKFTVLRTSDGKPAWEENIKQTVEIPYKGHNVVLTGMMDGQLVYHPTGEIVGFEFKTKSNSVAQVGTYKMKEPSHSHKQQCVAYSLMWGINTFIILYEAVAKDGWGKGIDARPDLRAFEFNVTDEMRIELLDKFVNIIEDVNSKTVPLKEPDKCMFCNYNSYCN